MTRLRTEPTGRAETVADLRALAVGLSRQAISLYADLAARMADFGNEAARAAFARVESMQRDHAPDGPSVMSKIASDVFQDEGLREQRLVNAYRAFALAVRNEERAFAFWSYMSAHARDPAVKKEAERMALAEMEHTKVLREERRAAYRDAGKATLEHLRTASAVAFRAEAAQNEAALAALHGRIVAALADADDRLAPVLDRIAREEDQSARELGAAGDAPSDPEPLPSDVAGLCALAVERLEIAVELYLFAAEASGDEDAVAVAQDLAGRGLDRIARLR